MDKRFAAAGVSAVTDTSAYNGKYYALTTILDTVFASISSPKLDGDFTGLVIPAGVHMIIPDLTGVQLTSGAVLLYIDG